RDGPGEAVPLRAVARRLGRHRGFGHRGQRGRVRPVAAGRAGGRAREEQAGPEMTPGPSEARHPTPPFFPTPPSGNETSPPLATILSRPDEEGNICAITTAASVVE